jgi:hypothetical protein
MAELKTRPTGVSVDAFLDGVADPGRRADAHKVRALMERLSGEPAAMWGPTIVGFGRYQYKYDSGHAGEMARIGFSPRGRELVFYLFPRPQPLMDRLGKHRTGKACLYIKRLADVDEAVLEALIVGALAYMAEKYPGGS